MADRHWFKCKRARVRNDIRWVFCSICTKTFTSREFIRCCSYVLFVNPSTCECMSWYVCVCVLCGFIVCVFFIAWFAVIFHVFFCQTERLIYLQSFVFHTSHESGRALRVYFIHFYRHLVCLIVEVIAEWWSSVSPQSIIQNQISREKNACGK